jgi:hypothetical protein
MLHDGGASCNYLINPETKLKRNTSLQEWCKANLLLYFSKLEKLRNTALYSAAQPYFIRAVGKFPGDLVG